MPKHYLKTKILKIFKFYNANSLIGTSPQCYWKQFCYQKNIVTLKFMKKVILWAVHGKLEIFLKLKTLKLVAIFLLLGETDYI